MTYALALEYGLDAEEYRDLCNRLERVPNTVELGIIAALWSEHCSYKSSKQWLRMLPTQAPWVIQGPGENAGIVDIGDGLVVIFKMESHNHPSMIEPYQGAATGVGGILRDVFSMGARPIASLNGLVFGEPVNSKMRYLIRNVVAGIGGYGNCVGIPTVGGHVEFHSAYTNNILVNVMTVGIAPVNKTIRSAATGTGDLVGYLGAKTGKDGIHGATMASAAFSDEPESQKPTVQVGDPFTEKCLLEACLELIASDRIHALQDLGAAGLSSAAAEMANKGQRGIWLDLDAVPVRAKDMNADEIMLSESQERMLLILDPTAQESVQEIAHKWGLAFSVIGRVSDDQCLTVIKDNVIKAQIPIEVLINPKSRNHPYHIPSVPLPAVALPDIQHDDIGPVLLKLLGSVHLCAKRWIWEQYDSQVGADTVFGPGQADAAVVRVHGTNKGLAMTIDCTPRYCASDPLTGGRQVVAEVWRNLNAVGSCPLALTDNLNFGNPENPEIMGQLIHCLEGMSEACRELEIPIVSGNVSLYNEAFERSILPTPMVGGVGLIDDVKTACDLGFKAENESIVMIGTASGHLEQSLYLRLSDCEEGSPPPVDLAKEKRTGNFIRSLIQEKKISACHDVSDGGLLVAIAEMALQSDIGATLYQAPEEISLVGFWFGEDQGRYIVTSSQGETIKDHALAHGLESHIIGMTGGSQIRIMDRLIVTLEALRHAHDDFFPQLMEKRS